MTTTPPPPKTPRFSFEDGQKVLAYFGPCALAYPTQAKVLKSAILKGRCICFITYRTWDHKFDRWVLQDSLVKFSKQTEAALKKVAIEDLEKMGHTSLADVDNDLQALMEKYSFVQDKAWRRETLHNRLVAVRNLIHNGDSDEEDEAEEWWDSDEDDEWVLDLLKDAKGKNTVNRTSAAPRESQAGRQRLTHRDILHKAIAGKKLSHKSRIEAQNRAKSLQASRLRDGITIRCEAEQD